MSCQDQDLSFILDNVPIYLSLLLFSFQCVCLRLAQQSDFDEYKGRLGERSPTPFDAFRFAQLESAIVNSLSPSDMSNYVNAIWVWKGKEPGDKTRAAAIIRELEAKAVGPPQSKKKLPRNVVAEWSQRNGTCRLC